MKLRTEILAEEDVNCIDELMVEGDHINAIYEIWLSAEDYFGVDFDEYGPDASIDFYTNWYPEDHRMEAFYIIRDDSKEEKVPWELKEYEKSLLYWKMQKHCLEKYQKDLMAIYQEASTDELSVKSIANILYNMSLDMDYADALDTYDVEIDIISKEIEELKSRNSSLYFALENIANENQNMIDWVQSLSE